MLASSAFAQGLLNWNTSAGTGSKIKYGSDAAFGAAAGTFYNGTFAGSSPLKAGIWVGAANTPESGLVLVDASTVTVATSGISAANVAGMAAYGVPNYGPGTTISLQVRAWSGATYGAGTVAGKSGVTQITLGGPAPNPAVATWSLTGVGPASSWNSAAPTGTGTLAGFTLSVVPEPASASLLGLGLASLLIFRRRK